MYQPINPHIPAPPTKKLKVLAGVSLVTVGVLTIVIIVLCLQLVTQFRRTDTQAQNVHDLTTILTKTKDELTLAKRQLIVQSLLPKLDSFPAQCPDGNEKDGLFTPLSQTPIQSYNVFLVDCRSYITTGKSLPRILIFHVNNSGEREFIYGSNTAEPLCITNKIPVANTLAQSLSLPVCQTN